MISKNIVAILTVSLACFRAVTAAAIPNELPASSLVLRTGTPSRTRSDVDNSSLDERGAPSPPTYTQYQAGNLNSINGPLPPGQKPIPYGPGSVICLCNNEDFGDCMCISDAQNGVWDTCLSNRGSSGQWSGFSNDAISSVSISGSKAGACKFYNNVNCMGQPMLIGSAATSTFLQPQMPAGTNDKLSSIFCGEPQEIVIGGD